MCYTVAPDGYSGATSNSSVSGQLETNDGNKLEGRLGMRKMARKEKNVGTTGG